MYTIRALSEQDLPDFLQLFATSLQEDYPDYPIHVADQYKKIFNKDYFIRLLQKNKGTVLGAYEDKLIGFIVIEKDDGGVVKFHWFTVNKNYREQGIGSALLKSAEEWCLENKCHYVFFYTENLKNVEYYKKREYNFVGIQKNSWFGIDEYVMEKQLKSSPFKEVFN